MSIERPLCVLAAALVLALGGCREEGTAEQAGRQIDEAMEQAREQTEETLDDLGREVDEAMEESEEAMRKMREGGE
jgi:hyperosmotically inducible protein